MSLATQLAEHRSMYREELRIRTTSRNVPADTEPIQISEWSDAEDGWRPGAVSVETTDSGELGGMALSPAMNRRLGPPTGYGAQYPWAHSWSYLRRACRNDHPGHTERPEFGGALCWQIVSWAVISDYEPATIAGILRMPLESVERHLRNAFAWIIEDMDRKQRIRNARDPQPSEEPTPSRLSLLQCDSVTRAVQNFDLEQRIWEGQIAVQRRHLPEPPDEAWERRWSWETEWARRQAALLDHQRECDRCRRAA